MAEAMQFENRTSMESVLATQRGSVFLLIFFGSFVNILVLTGPIFALQVYDRVLSSRSEETLLVLSLLMAFLFIIMGILDHVRKRIASRIGQRIVVLLERPVFQFLATKNTSFAPACADPESDLETIRRFFASPVPVALTDILWIPVFVVGLAVLHPMLGWLAVFGGSVFFVPAIWNLLARHSGHAGDNSDLRAASVVAGTARTGALYGLLPDPMDGLFGRWKILRNCARIADTNSQDIRAVIASAIQTFRMFLQSATIALGAYLVLQGQLTPGAIIASTVLLARALGPLDMVSQNTRTISSLIGASRRLAQVFIDAPIPKIHSEGANSPLCVDQLTVFPPGRRQAALRMVSFRLEAGTAFGVTGPTGAGKSALVQAIAGLWPIAGGSVRLGTTSIGWRTAGIGYLPQNPVFLSGSIAQNVAGFGADNGIDGITKATRATGAHERIQKLPDGYDTQLGPDIQPFSSGLAQRIALARALFCEPQILVLDAPCNQLDQDGIDMVCEIIQTAKTAGCGVLVVSRTPAILECCEQILVLENGIQKFLGPHQKLFPPQSNSKNVAPIPTMTNVFP